MADFQNLHAHFRLPDGTLHKSAIQIIGGTLNDKTRALMLAPHPKGTKIEKVFHLDADGKPTNEVAAEDLTHTPVPPRPRNTMVIDANAIPKPLPPAPAPTAPSLVLEKMAANVAAKVGEVVAV